MRIIAFDTETHLIAPGLQHPPLVCLTWQEIGQTPQIVRWDEAEALFSRWLQDPETRLVGHNLAFDMGVVMAKFPHLTKAIFQAYDADRCTDTMIRQQLIDIAMGRFRGFADKEGVWQALNYSLADLVRRHTGHHLTKAGPDHWRLRYSELEFVPLEDWPQEATEYALMDAAGTLAVYLQQSQHAKYLEDQYRQTRAAWALNLTSSHGLQTDKDGVETFAKAVEEQYNNLREILQREGLVREDGVRNIKAARARMLEVNPTPRLTKAGAVCLDQDACSSVDDPLMQTFGEFQVLTKIKSNDIKMMRSAVGQPIHPRYGMAESGRTTCSGPNIQALRKKEGIREAFITEPGWVFAQADYEGLELHTLAQACLDLFKESRLAEVLNAGLDPHMGMAALLMHKTYEWCKENKKDPQVKHHRDLGKVVNFGKPGGLGDPKLVFWAKKAYGLVLSVFQARDLSDAWLKQWPEMNKFRAFMSDLTKDPSAQYKTPRSNRYRGRLTYCGASNTAFQGPGADVAKRALYLVVRACYTDENSPLFGAKTVAFVHDEIITKVRDDERAHDAAQELGRLMLEAAKEFCPDVPCKLEPLLMRVWSKGAQAVYDAKGRLVPWQPTS